MATINAVSLAAEALTVAAFTATAPGGDLIQLTDPNKDLVIEFNNTAGGAVVPTIANQLPASLDSKDYGKVEKADLSVSIAAGATRCVLIPAKTLQHYLNGSSQIALSYTSHDVGLLVRALSMAG